jgi:hypothetical protein
VFKKSVGGGTVKVRKGRGQKREGLKSKRSREV